MGQYANNLSGSIILINRMINYFESNPTKSSILKQISEDTKISNKNINIILPFLVYQGIILKTHTNGNITTYGYCNTITN